MNTEMPYQEQAEKFMQDTGTTMKSTFLKHGTYFAGETDTRDIYRVTLIRNHKVFSFTFGQAIDKSDGKTTPTAYDILATLTKDEPLTFENFCSDYDYSTDSIKALKTYKAVVKEFQGVQRLFGDVMNQLAEIQ